MTWLFVGAVGLAAAATAAASNFGPIAGSIYYADGTHHTFTWESLANFEAASNWVRTNELAPTDMTTAVIDDHAEADVAVYDADYGDIGWCGIADCILEKSSTVCEHFHVQYNQANGVGCPDNYTTTERRSLACEEIGHTVGLQHRVSTAAGCMSQQWEKTHFSPHDVAHIDGKY